MIGFVRGSRKILTDQHHARPSARDSWDQLEHARRSPAQRIGFPGSYLVIVIGVVTATSTSAIPLPAPSTRSPLNGDMGRPHSRRTQELS